MSTDAPIAASSAAVETTPVTLESLSDSQRSHWRLTGELPTSDPPRDPTPAAESSPAEPAAQAASTEVSIEAASEPAAASRKKGADARIQELLVERHTLRQELDALKAQRATPAPAPDAPPAASSPAPLPVAPFPAFAEWVQQPGNEAREYEDYLEERIEFRAAQKVRQQQEERVREERQRTVQERTAAFKQQFQAAVQADPTLDAFAATLPMPVDHLPANQPIGALNVLAQEIYQSPHAVQALQYFATRREELDRFARMSSFDAIVRAFGRLETQWEAPADSGPRSPVPVITQAPPPPPSLASRATAPTNEIEAALAAGDYRRYKELANARDVAARR